MKINKVKAKKGMTLIEVIISVALLAILIIPLSRLVMSSLKNNIDSEDMQKASYIGQKVLEELKAYDEIKLKPAENNRKYFELLDGDKIVQDLEGKFVGSFDRTIYGGTSESAGKNEDIYKVNVNLEKDKNFQYTDVNNLVQNNNSGFRLNFIKDNMIEDNLNRTYGISDKLTIVLDKNSNDLVVYKENDSTPLATIERINTTTNNIVLYVKREFSKNLNIEFKNNTNETIEIHMIKKGNNSSKFKIYSSVGNVILYEENEVEENKIGDMYNYKVIVKDKKNNTLFQGSSSNNVNIK